MANARALDKRRKSIRNIRKITRTMELIATARFKRAMDRATAATAYTDRITRIVSDLAGAGLQVSHPLLEPRPKIASTTLLVLTANRGLCGGYNASAVRMGLLRYMEWFDHECQLRLEVSGKRGISAFRFRKIPLHEAFTQFDDQPLFADVEEIADRYLEEYTLGRLDRLDVVYTRFLSRSRQQPVTETLLPLGSLVGQDAAQTVSQGAGYEFLPSAESILQEIVPASFKVRLYKCFLDAAVSEQVARMVAMKGATDNASDIIKQLSMTYNRARQSQITTEIMDIIGGVEALG
jgi:F-type H+-transporting ATPase subunit gamma